LFGTLARYTKGSLGEALINTIHQNLPTIILHVQDIDSDVVKACKAALRLLVPTLGSKELPKPFEQKPFDPDGTVDYDKFAEEFAALWISQFRERISDMVTMLVLFFKSEWETVCAGACLIVGYILSKLNEEQLARVNLRHTCTELVSLLRSQSKLIREKAGKVLGLLHKA
jgi:hypothetical protein